MALERAPEHVLRFAQICSALSISAVWRNGRPISSMPSSRQYRPLDTRSRKPHSQIAVSSTPVCALSSAQYRRAQRRGGSVSPVARSCSHQSRSTTPRS